MELAPRQDAGAGVATERGGHGWDLCSGSQPPFKHDMSIML